MNNPFPCHSSFGSAVKLGAWRMAGAALLGFLLVPVAPALAADAQVRPGLWQFSSEGSMRGLMAGQMKELEAQLAKLPPAQQAQMRAMMEAQMSKSMGARDECITPEQARQGLKYVVEDMKDDAQCQQTVKWYGSSKADVKMVCPDGDVSDYTIEIKSPTQIESKITVTPPADSGGEASTMTWRGTWKQDACG